MAQPTTARFGAFLIKLNDAASPSDYVAPCGFTSKSLTLTKNLQEVNLPDCDDPDAPSWVGRDVESLSAAINGEGVMAQEALARWLEAAESTDPVGVQIELTLGAEVTTWEGLMHIDSLAIAAEQGGRVTISVSMQSDGELSRETV